MRAVTSKLIAILNLEIVGPETFQGLKLLHVAGPVVLHVFNFEVEHSEVPLKFQNGWISIKINLAVMSYEILR